MQERTNKKKMYVAVIALTLALPGVAKAEEQATKHLTLDEITVMDDGVTDPTATAVGANTIEKGRNINLPDVLKNEPDIDIKRRAGVGDTADILAIRGLSANRIMLNVNDRPVNAAGVVGGYYIDWGTIPLDNIEKIEVIRGGSSARYGNNALGGVINVVTKKPTEKPTMNFSANYGAGSDIDSFQNYRLTHTYKVGPVGYSLAGSFQKADEFLWNNDFEGKNLAGNFYVDMPLKGELTLGVQYADAIRGFIRDNRKSTDPDSANFTVAKNTDYPVSFGETFSPYSGRAFDPGPGAEWDKEKYYLDLGYKQPIGDALLEFKMYQNHEDRLEKNYSSTAIVPSYANGRLVLDREVQSDRSYGGNLQITKPLAKHELQVGIDYKLLAYGDIVLNYVDATYNGRAYTASQPSQEGESWGCYLQDSWAINDRFTLTPGLRYDTFTNISINGAIGPELNDNALTPKLTGTYQITSADVVTASLYQAFRTPGLPETYWWNNGGLTRGNPLLKPEKNNAGELTYQHDFATKDTVKLSAYYYQVDDYIIFRGGYNANVRGVYNLDEAVLQGLSADAHHPFTDWLTGRATLTYQKTKKEGGFDFDKIISGIDNLPDWKASAGLEFKLPHQAVLNTTVRYVGGSEMVYLYTTGTGAGTTQRYRAMDIDSYVTADIDFKIPLNKNCELGMYAENLFDQEYEEQFGYPMPGLVVGTTLKVGF